MRRVLVLVIAAVLTAACGGRIAGDDDLTGRMLLWHAYDDVATAALDDILSGFAELNPSVIVKTQRFATEEEMMQQFRLAVDSGLGPDALITSSEWVLALVADGALRPLNGVLTEQERARFMSDALQVLEIDGMLFGLPQSVNTTVLFYNKDLVEVPAATLSDLLAEATAGNFVAMNSNFDQAFWGIHTFGGELFDEDGRVILDRGGFANWLEWLKTVRDMPSVVLDSDVEFLRSQFVNGATAYYVTTSQELPHLMAAMGDALGVAVLPSGPVGSAAPFLTAESILLSAASSDEQAALAFALSEFLTNAEQSASFMRATQRVPANENVRINSRLNPETSALATQARSAVPLPNSAQRDTILRAIAQTQARVLEGILEPAAAALQTTQSLNAQLGIDGSEPTVPACESVAVLHVASTLDGPMDEQLVEQTRAFREICPSVIVDLTSVSAAEAISTTLAGTPATRVYDLVIGDQSLLLPLVKGERLQELGTRADAERLQRYWPQTLDALRVDGGLYGLPLAANTHALYVNVDLVDQPARTMDELARQVRDGIPITLEAGFVPGFWGIAAFSPQPTNAGLALALDLQATTEWLNWLRTLQDDSRSQIVFSRDEARQAFVAGESAYYVGTLADYPTLLESIGADNVDVVTFPSGPGGDASPLMEAVGIMLVTGVTDGRLDAAAEYSRFITGADNQQQLAGSAHMLPANASTDLSGLAAVAQFIEQMQTATVRPNIDDVQAIVELGDEMYRAALEDDDVDVSRVVSTTIMLMSDLLGIDVVEATGQE